MVYSKRVTDLQQIYQLTPDDVFFCMLVASGASRGEAYATIFRPRSTKIETAQRGAAQLAKDKPGINKLIRSFEDNRAAFLPDNDSPKSKGEKIKMTPQTQNTPKPYETKTSAPAKTSVPKTQTKKNEKKNKDVDFAGSIP